MKIAAGKLGKASTEEAQQATIPSLIATRKSIRAKRTTTADDAAMPDTGGASSSTTLPKKSGGASSSTDLPKKPVVTTSSLFFDHTLDPVGMPVSYGPLDTDASVGGVKSCLLYTSPSPRDS